MGQHLLLRTAPNEKLRGSECTRFAHGAFLFRVLCVVTDALLYHRGYASTITDLIKVETTFPNFVGEVEVAF